MKEILDKESKKALVAYRIQRAYEKMCIRDRVRSVTQEEVTKEELGGVGVHMTKSGVANLYAENDIECINYIRELISYLPGNNMEEPPMCIRDSVCSYHLAYINSPLFIFKRRIEGSCHDEKKVEVY